VVDLGFCKGGGGFLSTDERSHSDCARPSAVLAEGAGGGVPLS